MSAVKCGLTIIPIDTPGDFTRICEEIDGMDVDYLWLCDSSLHSRDWQSYLTIAALHTRRTLLGLNMANPYTRHPAMTLNAISTIDAISGGRAHLSFGAGAEPLFEVGYARGKVSTVREAVEASKRLLREEKVDYAGAEIRLTGAALYYKSRPDIPIYVTASGPKMLEMAGEVADGVIFLSGSYPDCVRLALGHVERGARKAGRSLKDIDVTWCGVGAIREERRLALEESRTLAAWVVKYAPHYAEIAGVPKEVIETVKTRYAGGHFHEARAAAEALSLEHVDRLSLAGSPADFRERIAAVVDLGVNHIEYEIMGGDRLAAARLYGREVVPHFR